VAFLGLACMVAPCGQMVCLWWRIYSFDGVSAYYWRPLVVLHTLLANIFWLIRCVCVISPQPCRSLAHTVHDEGEANRWQQACNLLWAPNRLCSVSFTHSLLACMTPSCTRTLSSCMRLPSCLSVSCAQTRCCRAASAPTANGNR
jgi:hypothetical protein